MTSTYDRWIHNGEPLHSNLMHMQTMVMMDMDSMVMLALNSWKKFCKRMLGWRKRMAMKMIGS
jgi:hypothetical protein